MRRFAPWRTLIWAVPVALATTALRAEPPPSTPSGRQASPDGSDAVRKKRDAVSREIKRLVDEQAAEASSDESAADNAAHLASLRTLQAVLVQQIARSDERHRLDGELMHVEDDLEKLKTYDPDEPKPYSFLLLDRVKDEAEVEGERKTVIEAEVAAAKRALKAAHQDLNATAERRQAAASELSPEAMEGAIARARVGLKQTEVEVQQARLALSKAQAERLDRKIKAIRDDAEFSPEDLAEVLERLKAGERDLARRRQAVEETVGQLDAQKGKGRPETEASPAAAHDASEAFAGAIEASESELELIERSLDERRSLRQFWKHRFEVATRSPGIKSLQTWQDELDEFLEQLKTSNASLTHRRTTVRAKLAAIAHEEGGDDSAAAAVEARRNQLDSLSSLIETLLQDNQSSDRMLRRFRGELLAKIKESGGQRSPVADRLRGLLGLEVTENEDEKVTVGQLLLLVAYVLGGILLAYSLSRVLGRTVLRQLGFNRGTATALRSIVFYSLCLIFGIVSFRLLNIPLAAFAFVGGAAAIAVGFGSQDIMNNFMSGIILLTEQPIRVGDVVEISGVQGVVLHIGLRSTRLQTDTNHELIVPNKTLLDETVTNLTLSDNLVQMYVSVALERNDAVEDIKRKMLKIAFSHPLVVKSPRPVVLLTEFDSYYNLMTFEIHFWLQMTSFIRCATVKSEILEVVTDAFPSADGFAATSAPPTDEGSGGDSDEGPDTPSADPAAPSQGPLSGDRTLLRSLKKMGRLAIAKELKRIQGA